MDVQFTTSIPGKGVSVKLAKMIRDNITKTFSLLHRLGR